jgi:hypothetical protein
MSLMSTCYKRAKLKVIKKISDVEIVGEMWDIGCFLHLKIIHYYFYYLYLFVLSIFLVLYLLLLFLFIYFYY